MSATQDNYSYDAPSTCINFGSIHDEDYHNVDSWFDQVADTENIPPQNDSGSEKSSVGQTAFQQNSNLVSKADVGANISGKDWKGQKTPLTSVCSLGRKSDPDFSDSKSQARRSSRRLSDQERRKRLSEIRAKRHLVSSKTVQSDECPPLKKQKISTSVTDGNNWSSPKLTHLTIPLNPTVLKRRNALVKQKNSEQRELEKIQQLQQEMLEKLKKNEQSFKAAITGAGQLEKKMVIPVTKPVDFHFRTDDRIKHEPEPSGDHYKEVDFIAALRKHLPSPVQIPKGGRTIPKPFNLSQGNKRKHEEANSTEFISIAEQVISFQKRTPSRYHLRSRQKEMAGPSPVKLVKPKLTNPKTPLLHTKQRHRPVTCKSTLELEAEELEKLQQYKFKAQDLDMRILEGGPVLPKKPPVKEPTKAIGFNLEIEKRIQQREKREEGEEEEFAFHSKPCPTKILADVVGVPQKKILPVTVPQSPAFALRNRVRVQSWEEEKEEVPVIKAKPVPHYGVPFIPKCVEQKALPCPFSFSDRDKERQLQKEKRLDELRKEDVPKFKAQPLPVFDQVSLPGKKLKMPTQQEPFELETDRRGASKVQRWQQQIKEELKQQKEMSVFKARSNTVTHQEPFLPKKENRSLIESLSGSKVQESFELATERRARERQEFEKSLTEMEAQKSLLEEEERKRKEEQEKEEISQLRQDLVHKAQPIRKYKAVEIKPCEIPLTIPKTPKFSDRFKC